MATMFHSLENTPEEKNHTPERELVLRPMEGKKPLNGIGLVDPRLFKGGNKLHAIMAEDGLWYCKYADGNVPEPLKIKFTTVKKLVEHVKAYFETRNIEIVEVKNAS